MIPALRLTVLTPVATVLEAEELAWIQVRLADGGGLGIFPGHAPLLAETVGAPVRYADAEGEHALDLDAGLLHVTAEGVRIFTSGALGAAATDEAGCQTVEQRFDRLAQALLATLHAEPAGGLGEADGKAGS